MKLFKFLSEEFIAGSVLYEDRENYYLQFIEATDFSYYIDLLKPQPDCVDIKTSIDIKLFGLEFGSNTETVIKTLGKPRFQTSYKQHGYNTEVLFFKKVFYSYTAILQTHLVNNQLVYGAISVPKHDDSIGKIFSKLLSVKYSSEVNKHNLKCTINDAANNRILYRNLFYPTLFYISSNIHDIVPEIFAALEMSASAKNDKLNNSDWVNWL